MKKLLCILFILLSATFAFSTEIKDEIVCEHTFDFEPSIKVAKLWISEAFTSGKNVVDFYDEDLKVLTGIASSKYKDEYVYTYNFKFKISIKKNTVKVVFNNMTAGTMKLPITPSHACVDEFYNDLETLAKSLFKYYEEF